MTFLQSATWSSDVFEFETPDRVIFKKRLNNM